MCRVNMNEWMNEYRAIFEYFYLCVHLDWEPRPQEEEQEAAHAFQETVRPCPKENGKLVYFSIHWLIYRYLSCFNDSFLCVYRATVLEPGSWSGRKSKPTWWEQTSWFHLCSPPTKICQIKNVLNYLLTWSLFIYLCIYLITYLFIYLIIEMFVS